MPVSHSGNIYRFCSRAADIEDQLPAKIFDVLFDPQLGYSLMVTSMPPAEEMFGDMGKKIPKVVEAFKRREGNTGVILSGDKGLGKTLFARHLVNAVIEAGYPVLKITEYSQGITNFIQSIEQPVMLFFDEFAKIFPTGRRDDDDDGAQTAFLTLLDGTGVGKRLTVITCNKEDNLSSFFTNRPGRFYYNFHFEYPGMDTVKAYLKAQGVKDAKLIDRLSTLASLLRINFDSLRAISDEIVSGYTVEETLADLNLQDGDNVRCMRFSATDENGVTWTSRDDRFEYLKFRLTLDPGNSSTSYWNPVKKSGKFTGLTAARIEANDFIIRFDVSRLRPIGDGVYELSTKNGAKIGEVEECNGKGKRYKAKLVACRLYDTCGSSPSSLATGMSCSFD